MCIHIYVFTTQEDDEEKFQLGQISQIKTKYLECNYVIRILAYLY